MRKSSTVISHPQVDAIHSTSPIETKDDIKNLLLLTTGGQQWKTGPNSKTYAYSEIETTTGIKLFWNPKDLEKKSVFNGRLLCVVPGKYLKGLGLFSQVSLLRELNHKYPISQLHLKIQVDDPTIAISDYHSFVQKVADKNNTSLAFKPFRSAIYINSIDAEKHILSDTLYFPSNKRAKKVIAIYDPFRKHGITNTQHWELRVRDKYIKGCLVELFAKHPSEYELGKTLKELILESIDFTVDDIRVQPYNQLRRAKLIMPESA